MTIRLLDDQLINKIAAGEVIERPGSIVKELVENAIDAGGGKINVSIVRGGIERISVEDNGQGIAAEELEMALMRHATSKIAQEEELYRVQTMGFRGEALPSIASIARLEISTQAAGSAAMYARWEGGELLEMGPRPCPPGTLVTVEDVFFNTPVRRTFLKSAVSEQNHIYDIMLRLALSRPDISFSFASEKKLYFKTPGNGALADCVVSIYGADYAEQFIPVQWEGESSSLRGLISKPEFRRGNRKNQLFYVNRRSVRSPLLSRALEVAYQSYLLSKEYPAAILFLELEPGAVDINVHPQKLEVKFRDDQEVFRLLQQVVKARLEQHVYRLPETRPSLYRSPEGAPAGGGWKSPPPAAATADEARQFYHPAFSFRPERAYDAPGAAADGLIDGLIAEAAGPISDRPRIEDIAVIGQLFQTYVLAESADALWIIDQHAAQERIMFNRLEDHYREHDWEQQILALPLGLSLEPRRMELVEARLDDFARLGIDLQVLGPTSIALRALPAYFKGQEQALLEELIAMMERGDEERFYHDALAGMACKASVRAGDSLSRPELHRLLADLLECREYKNCPHGRPLIFQISRADIVRYFKRV